jgi:hypothetical protein
VGKLGRLLNHLLLLLPIAAVAVGCASRQCTEAGCFSGFQLQIRPALTEPGAYRFELMGEETFSCSATLGSEFVTEQAGTCDVQGSTNGIAGLSVSSHHPVEVTLRVLRDSVQIASTKVELTYVTNQPNGEDCPPTCRESAAEVDLR